eukprot:1404764-Prymnesium_polylepis.1
MRTASADGHMVEGSGWKGWISVSTPVGAFCFPSPCLELGPLAALNFGRLATWSWKNRAAGDRDCCFDGEEE